MAKGGIPTILKDGSKIEHNEIVRFNSGRNSLMMVEKTERALMAKEKRLYGKNIYGDYHVAWAHNCMPATDQDKRLWAIREGDRVNYTDGRQE